MDISSFTGLPPELIALLVICHFALQIIKVIRGKSDDDMDEDAKEETPVGK